MASDITGPDQLSQQLDQLSMDAKDSNNSSREYSSPQTAQGVAISQGAHQEHLESDPSNDNVAAGLETLPAELLCLIDDHLDAGDGLVIRVTCRRLRDVLTSLKSRTAAVNGDSKAKASLKRKLVQDAIRGEQEGIFHLGPMQACTGCSAFHDEKLFPDKRREQSSRLPLCLGHAQEFHLCEHVRCNYFQLSSLPNIMWKYCTGGLETVDDGDGDPREHFHITQNCNCEISASKSTKSPDNTWELKGEKSLDEYAPPDECNSLSPVRLSKERGLLVTIQLSQSEIIGIFPRDEDSICNRIKNWDWEICAHLRVGHLGAQFFEDLCWKAVHWEFVKDSYSAQCDNEHCKASFKLTLSTWYDEQPEILGHRTTSIDFGVFRQVEIYGMEGPDWLENSEAIEDDSKDYVEGQVTTGTQAHSDPSCGYPFKGLNV
ncbi:hypothetical protein IWZ00DRAFT_570137 [Phyllosticta capitalensis]|uniref:F-box domain-containing protein n=1 Tax=Phyllosticta capitalensis TaxID=121624 RepID=A0ABR1YWH7_9PEZI